MNNSDEHEHGAQSPKVAPTKLRPKNKKIDAERNQTLGSLLKAVEAKKDEILTWKNIENNNLSDPTLVLPELKSSKRRRKVGMSVIELEQPTSKNEVPLTIRKRRRKQERPRRAPMGGGIDQILEADNWAEPPPEDNKKKKKKEREGEKCSLSKFACSWGRK